MADNDQYDDEYQFSDLDNINLEPEEEADELSASDTAESKPVVRETNVKRNALIAVALIIIAMLTYKFLGAIFTEKKAPSKPKVAQAPQTTPQPPKPVPVQPIASVAQPPAITSKVDQKLSALEVTQRNLNTDVNALGNKLEGVGQSMSQMSNQIAELNQTIAELNHKIDEQSRDIDRLRAVSKRKAAHKVARKPAHGPVKYYVQALIPGRAWLIGSNGSTLTVREGSTVPGYGVVKLIDPLQGRVLTSTGHVIRFSQSDS